MKPSQKKEVRMKKLFSHSAIFVAFLLAPMSVFAKQANTKFHHRAAQTAHETRYEQNCLSTFEVELMGGRAKKGYNGTKDKVNALEIYGLNHLGVLAGSAAGDPNITVHNANLQLLVTAGANDSDLTIGVNFDGKYSMFEANLSYTQNFCNGFFVDINLPVKRLKIGDITTTDGSVAADLASAPGSAAIITDLVTNLETALSTYDLSIAEASKTGLGDVMVTGGWTCNHDDVENLDFLDTTIKLGVSIPTAKKRDQDKAFELALGYEGHTGIAASFDLGVGFYEWMTLGAHIGGLFFLDKTINMRMQTNANQSGWLKLSKGDAKYDMGNIWNAGGHFKADHIFKGVSLMFGYNYVHKDNDTLTPENTVRFPVAAVNADDMFKSWTQHAVTVTLEYDMAEEGRRWNPYFSVFYSRPVKGKYIFVSDVGGGTAGVNVAMDF